MEAIARDCLSNYVEKFNTCDYCFSSSHSNKIQAAVMLCFTSIVPLTRVTREKRHLGLLIPSSLASFRRQCFSASRGGLADSLFAIPRRFSFIQERNASAPISATSSAHGVQHPDLLVSAWRHHPVVTKGQPRVTFGACTLARKLVRLFSELNLSIDKVSAFPRCSKWHSLWA